MGKILVTYFSATGATKKTAEKIAGVLDADLFEIEPEVKYTEEDLRWTDRNCRATQETKNKKFRPLVSNKLENSSDYDKIVLGFPVWNSTAPNIVNSFIEENNLDGKQAYVFCTSGASSVDKSFKDLKRTYPEVDFISGKRFNGCFYRNEIEDWVNDRKFHEHLR